MTRLGIVTGLVREAAIIEQAARHLPEHSRPLVFCAGGNNRRAEDGASELAGRGVDGLVSFGVAGGLDPALTPGDIVIAERILTGKRALETSANWRGRLTRHLPASQACHNPGIFSVDTPVTTAGDKAKLWQGTGAVAVDMESGGVAVAAAHANLPFLCVRAVVDPFDQSIPGAAAMAMRPDGTVSILAVLARLLLAPGQLPDLIRLGRADAKAMTALGRVAALGLPSFFLG
ncbi:MAG: hypothetical protein ACE5EM_03580 [Sphingomonadales bacterium]